MAHRSLSRGAKKPRAKMPQPEKNGARSPKSKTSPAKGGDPRRRKRQGPPTRVILPLHKTPKERRIEGIQRWMDENLPPQGSPAWEALCTGCGECCYDKVWRGERLYVLTSACGFLDMETNRCQVYEERFDKEPLCMPIGPEIIEMGGLPADCPYVQGLPGYKGPIPLKKTIDEV